MVQRRTLELTKKERDALVACRDHDPHPQMRERCAALLKIADGMSPHAVALGGLLRRRDPDSVYSWMGYYQGGGLGELRAHLHGAHPRGRLRRRPDSRPGAVPSRSRSGG